MLAIAYRSQTTFLLQPGQLVHSQDGGSPAPMPEASLPAYTTAHLGMNETAVVLRLLGKADPPQTRGEEEFLQVVAEGAC